MKLRHARKLQPGNTVFTRGQRRRWSVRTFPRPAIGGGLEVGCWNGERFHVFRTNALELFK